MGTWERFTYSLCLWSRLWSMQDKQRLLIYMTAGWRQESEIVRGSQPTRQILVWLRSILSTSPILKMIKHSQPFPLTMPQNDSAIPHPIKKIKIKNWMTYNSYFALIWSIWNLTDGRGWKTELYSNNWYFQINNKSQAKAKIHVKTKC